MKLYKVKYYNHISYGDYTEDQAKERVEYLNSTFNGCNAHMVEIRELESEPYLTPHERLLKLGWKMVNTHETYKIYNKFDDKYSRFTMSIKINKDKDGWYVTLGNATYIDKELTTILLEYLDELELEK